MKINIVEYTLTVLSFCELVRYSEVGIAIYITSYVGSYGRPCTLEEMSVTSCMTANVDTSTYNNIYKGLARGVPPLFIERTQASNISSQIN